MTSKKELSERDICTKYIQPALEKAGWNQIALNQTHAKQLMQVVLKEAFSQNNKQPEIVEAHD